MDCHCISVAAELPYKFAFCLALEKCRFWSCPSLQQKNVINEGKESPRLATEMERSGKEMRRFEKIT
ncbi:hypothetical protein M514_01252 [Trichuris suis]|uniref:Uncharacterized protein n=1 Tax=Trichuris suis TaxID=68888 RepID=A0A085MLC3_9BILA|nr:hypothetical protein M513_01252 [Trichuris suis]KFD70795.1 hypothetical protein M514_01252 [Trichuris suis]